MDWDFWVTLVKFLWRRDSDSAFCLMVWLEIFLNDDDLHFAASYLRASHDTRRENEEAAQRGNDQT